MTIFTSCLLLLICFSFPCYFNNFFSLFLGPTNHWKTKTVKKTPTGVQTSLRLFQAEAAKLLFQLKLRNVFFIRKENYTQGFRPSSFQASALINQVCLWIMNSVQQFQARKDFTLINDQIIKWLFGFFFSQLFNSGGRPHCSIHTAKNTATTVTGLWAAPPSACCSSILIGLCIPASHPVDKMQQNIRSVSVHSWSFLREY